MRCSRFYTTPAGGSAFDTVEIPLDRSFEDGHGNRIRTTRTFASTGVRLLEMPVGLVQDWHPAPAHQLVVVLAGVWEVTTSDGAQRRWGPGEAFVPADLTGAGHQSRVVEGPVRLLFVPFPAEFDPGAAPLAPD